MKFSCYACLCARTPFGSYPRAPTNLSYTSFACVSFPLSRAPREATCYNKHTPTPPLPMAPPSLPSFLVPFSTTPIPGDPSFLLFSPSVPSSPSFPCLLFKPPTRCCPSGTPPARAPKGARHCPARDRESEWACVVEVNGWCWCVVAHEGRKEDDRSRSSTLAKRPGGEFTNQPAARSSASRT